jgi:hypothetical protein
LDDFSDPVSGWPTVNDEFVEVKYAAGEYLLHLKISGVLAWAWPGIQASDSDISVDVRSGCCTDGTSGIMFGLALDGSRMYTFEIGRDQHYELWRADASGWELLGSGSSGFLKPGDEKNLLMVRREGPMIHVFANGHLLLSKESAELAGPGYTGVVASVYDAPTAFDYFDNFNLRPAQCGGVFDQISLPSSGNIPSINSDVSLGRVR